MHPARLLQRVQLTLHPGNIRHLAADVPDKLRFLHPALLFLPVEDGVDAAVCISRVAAQVRHNGIAADLCPGERGVMPADDAERLQAFTVVSVWVDVDDWLP
nr:hypothetical protein [Enterobacter cancerogenus]